MLTANFGWFQFSAVLAEFTVFGGSHCEFRDLAT